MGPIEGEPPGYPARKPETVPEKLRRIAELLPRGSREWAELHRVSGYVETLEDHIERASKNDETWDLETSNRIQLRDRRASRTTKRKVKR